MSAVPKWHAALKAEAKAAGLKRFSSPLRCKHGHAGDWIVYSGACAECSRLHSLKKDASNRAAANARTKRYRENHRDLVLAKARERGSKDRSARWRARNPERSRQVSQNFRKRHLESERIRIRIHQSLRRAQKRERGGKLSPGIVDRLTRLQRGKCACCQGLLKVSGYHMDHVLPLALGGTHDDKNIQLLCPRCNLSKQAKHPVEFMQSRGMLL